MKVQQSPVSKRIPESPADDYTDEKFEPIEGSPEELRTKTLKQTSMKREVIGRRRIKFVSGSGRPTNIQSSPQQKKCETDYSHFDQRLNLDQ